MALAKPFLRVRHVVHVHAADVYFLRRVWAGQAIARFAVRSADGIFADGSHVRESLDGLIGRESGATLRPMGVWTTKFAPEGEAFESPFPGGYVLFVGRLVEKKGVIYLIRAMQRLRELHPDVGLLIVGGGPLEAELRAERNGLGLGDWVRFEGPKPHREVVSYLRGCLVVCVPSIIDSNGETEGMPTVVIEAMAAGALVVGSDVDGIPDVLQDQQNGWLCQPADVESLAEGLLAALESAAGPISLRGLETAASHDWTSVAGEYRVALDD